MNKTICQKSTVKHGRGMISENTKIAENTFHLTLIVTEPLPTIEAGQFVMLRLPNTSDPLLGRPLAVYRTDHVQRLEVVYIVVGKMTQRLSQLKSGEKLEFWTPLGRGFTPSEAEHTIMVAGGIGQTPFLMLAEKLQGRKTLLYGARSKHFLACVEDFKRTGTNVRIATDDGSEGYHGFVTDLIESTVGPEYDEPEYRLSGGGTQILCCGPHPMLKAAFAVARRLDLPCYVSLETPMSCGLGICFGCVIKYRNSFDDETFDYKRTCVDGPVFDAYRLCWD